MKSYLLKLNCRLELLYIEYNGDILSEMEVYFSFKYLYLLLCLDWKRSV